MNKGLKITLIIVGSLALAGGVAYLITKSVRKKRKEKEEIEKDVVETQQLEEINQNLESQQSTKDENIAPLRNLDKVLNNSFSDIKGIKLYPAKKSNDPVHGHPFAEGFANIRSSAEVNNSQGVWDLWQDNLMGKISAGQSIGTVISEQYDDMTPKMRWFKVKLTKKIDGKQYGWVRGDVVTFFPRKKRSTQAKSKFEGDFVQRYNNDYPLGAEVFPHPNWMVGYPAYGNDVMDNFEGNLDLDV